MPSYCIIYCVSQKQMFWPSFNFFFQCFQNRVCLTSSIFSSSISLNTVPLIWLGFSATQLNTGKRNLVLMGFLIFTATHRKHMSTTSCQLHKHNTCSLSDVELVCEQQAQIWTCPVHICEGTWGEMCEHETFDTVSINTLSLSYPDQCDFVDRISWS